MRFRTPKNDEKYEWTQHVVRKMLYYGISEGLIRRVIKSPKRVEEGIAENTIAVMQPTGVKRTKEVWVMYQLISSKSKVKSSKLRAKIRIISAWRYPGVSPVRAPIPIPPDVLADLIAYQSSS